MEAVVYRKELGGDLFEDAYPYDFKQIQVVLGKKQSLLDSVHLSVNNRTAEGTFAIPRKKRYPVVTKVQYNNACDDLARFLIAALAYFQGPQVNGHLSVEDYITARNGNKFRNPSLKLKFPHEIPSDQPFKIMMMLREAKKKDRTIYALMQVDGDVRGELLYTYTPQ
ncbi:MAG: hypothetical protein HY514_00125 [Candidatus Aenigmarchaeota archaeon]|nr:hypothetical protein [Candidatus Aenigmarchaeota archaeon]